VKRAVYGFGFYFTELPDIALRNAQLSDNSTPWFLTKYFLISGSVAYLLLCSVPDPDPDSLVTSKKFNFNHQTYFYNLEIFKFHLLKCLKKLFFLQPKSS
jgi:hypothetical protein